MFSSYPCPQATKILGVFFVFRRTVLALHPSGADNLDRRFREGFGWDPDTSEPGKEKEKKG